MADMPKCIYDTWQQDYGMRVPLCLAGYIACHPETCEMYHPAPPVVIKKDGKKMFECDSECKAAAEVLDKYDLSLVFKGHGMIDIYDLADVITEEFPEKEVEDALETLSADEIADYLVERYHMRTSEVIHTFLEWRE